MWIPFYAFLSDLTNFPITDKVWRRNGMLPCRNGRMLSRMFIVLSSGRVALVQEATRRVWPLKLSRCGTTGGNICFGDFECPSCMNAFSFHFGCTITTLLLVLYRDHRCIVEFTLAPKKYFDPTHPCDWSKLSFRLVS